MSYKVGDRIKEYIVTRDFDSANGGQCQWGFATRNGEEFFIKKFLNPVYPGEESPGSEKGKQKKRAKCQEFERKQLSIIKALSACGDGGLVVRTVDCFKYGNKSGSHYFKVSQKVDTSSMSDRVHTLETKKRLLVMLTAAGAVKILHANGIIHLDLKPDNILIQEWEGKLIAKVIDFDSSLLEGESIAPDDLVGDPAYYSPEFGQHIATSGETPPPTKKSDIFSLGLIFCQYWTGKFPTLPSDAHYAYEALLNGGRLTIPIAVSSGKAGSEGTATSSRLRFSSNFKKTAKSKTEPESMDTTISQLIEKMLVLDHSKRLSINEVQQSLKHLYRSGTLPKTEIEKPSPPTELKKTGSSGKLRIGKNLNRG